jgi:hypothetical protein
MKVEARNGRFQIRLGRAKGQASSLSRAVDKGRQRRPVIAGSASPNRRADSSPRRGCCERSCSARSISSQGYHWGSCYKYLALRPYVPSRRRIPMNAPNKTMGDRASRKREFDWFDNGLRLNLRKRHADESNAFRRREHRPDEVECQLMQFLARLDCRLD